MNTKTATEDHLVVNIERTSLANGDFRRVLYTSEYMQLTVMSLRPKEEIGEEMHEVDQFIRVEGGQGMLVLDGMHYPIKDGSATIIPAGTLHNVINTSQHKELKLYSIYAPPEHPDGAIHQTKADADAEEHR